MRFTLIQIFFFSFSFIELQSKNRQCKIRTITRGLAKCCTDGLLFARINGDVVEMAKLMVESSRNSHFMMNERLEAEPAKMNQKCRKMQYWRRIPRQQGRYIWYMSVFEVQHARKWINNYLAKVYYPQIKCTGHDNTLNHLFTPDGIYLPDPQLLHLPHTIIMRT